MNRLSILSGVVTMLIAGCSSTSSSSSAGEAGVPNNTDSGVTKPGSDGGGDPVPPHTVGKCDSLPAAGTLENITPTQLNFAKWCSPGSAACAPDSIPTYGAHSIAIDPTNSGTLYLGTSSLGFWKSTDCGSTWAKIDTGTHQAEIDSGRNWTIAIDPTNSQIIYTTPGYGAEGFYKSTDGGVNWEQMFPADIQKSLPYGGFIETISLDPSNHKHLLVSFHIDCNNNPVGGGDWKCMAESSDAGATWTLNAAPIGWSEGYGQTMIDSNTWFLNNGGGIWRTINAGAHWDQVSMSSAGGHVFVGPDKKFYANGSPLLQSVDGITWTPLDGSPSASSVNGSNPMVSDGTRLITSGGQYGGEEPKTGWYASAPLSDPKTWTPLFMPTTIPNGGSTLIYDPDHKVLYSANLTGGLWRGVVP